MGKLWEKISEKVSYPELDPDPKPDPDPKVRGTDPGIRIRIRTKMSRMPNTAKKFVSDGFRPAKKFWIRSNNTAKAHPVTVKCIL